MPFVKGKRGGNYPLGTLWIVLGGSSLEVFDIALRVPGNTGLLINLNRGGGKPRRYALKSLNLT